MCVVYSELHFTCPLLWSCGQPLYTVWASDSRSLSVHLIKDADQILTDMFCVTEAAVLEHTHIHCNLNLTWDSTTSLLFEKLFQNTVQPLWNTHATLAHMLRLNHHFMSIILFLWSWEAKIVSYIEIWLVSQFRCWSRTLIAKTLKVYLIWIHCPSFVKLVKQLAQIQV